MPRKVATGMPRGRPPAGGYAPEVHQAAKRRLAGEPLPAAEIRTDPAAVLALWQEVNGGSTVPHATHKRPRSIPSELIRMTPTRRCSISGPGIVKDHRDPDAIYVPEPRIAEMEGSGFKVDH